MRSRARAQRSRHPDRATGAPDKAIAALDQYGGTVIKTSLSDEDTAKLQEALNPEAVTA